MDSTDLRTALPDRPPPPPERSTPRAVRWVALAILGAFVVGEIVILAAQLFLD